MNCDRLSNIDVLRAMAALAVCLHHFSRPEFGAAWINILFSHGSLGVDVFFVISGFVLPLALYRSGFTPKAAPRFWCARFVRLYPAFLVALLGAMFLWHVSAMFPAFKGQGPRFSAGCLAANLTLSCDFFGQPWVIPVFWSLAIEAQYYILLACCFPLLCSPDLRLRLGMVGLWILSPLVVGAGPTVFSWTALFAMGLATWMNREKLLTRWQFALAVGASAAVHSLVMGGLAAVVGAGTAFCIAAGFPRPSRFLVCLGAISYSLYLVHPLVGARVMNLFARNELNGFQYATTLLLAMAVSVAAAWLLFAAVERPSHNAARRMRRSRA